MSGLWPLPTGTIYAAVIPINEYGTNGQTGITGSITGDGISWLANPGEGFEFGPSTQNAFDLSMRVSGTTEPCELPLGSCPQDMTGPDGSPDGVVTVDDILVIISNFGQIGDGTSRPFGDCQPLPAGDCAVTIDDLLSVIGNFGVVCEPTGACCTLSGGCIEAVTEAACQATWLGPGSTCQSCLPSQTGACCMPDGTCIDSLDGQACWDSGGYWSGLYSICEDVTCQAAPENDTCTSAIAIGEGETPIDLTWAYSDGDDISPIICDLGGQTNIANDIWFAYTCADNGVLSVSTCDSVNFDSRLAIYETCGGETIACNDDADGCAGYSSRIDYSAATAGTTYLIRVGAFTEGYGVSRSGTMTIAFEPASLGACCFDAQDCLDESLPLDCFDIGGVFQGGGTTCAEVDCAVPGDACETAIPFGLGVNLFDSDHTVPSAQTLPEESLCPDTNLHWFMPLPDLWGSYDVTTTGFLDITLCDPYSFDTSLVIYRGTDCNNLIQIACNGDAPAESGCQTNHSAIEGLQVLQGDRLYIRIAGVDSATGTGSCTITDAAAVLGTCCVAGNCTDDVTASDCLNWGGTWSGGVTCAGITCPEPPEPCTDGIGDDPLSPGASWIAGTSDSGEGTVRAAQLTSSSVSTCTIAGLAASFDGGGWDPCVTPADIPMVWTLLADDNGLPGTPLATGVADVVTELGAIYGNGFPLYAWSFAPNYTGPVDWISLSSQSDGEGHCWFLWMSSSPEGSGASAKQSNGQWFYEDYDLNYCVEE